jgi:hypothetical protein
MMTDQEAFNIAYKGLIEQGVRSYKVLSVRGDGDEEDITCQYRDPKGNKCAIGWLLPDYMIEPHNNSMALCGLIEKCPEVKNFLSGCSLSMLAQLQSVHDQKKNWPDIKGALDKFAVEWKLEVPDL